MSVSTLQVHSGPSPSPTRIRLPSARHADVTRSDRVLWDAQVSNDEHVCTRKDTVASERIRGECGPKSVSIAREEIPRKPVALAIPGDLGAAENS